MYCNIIFELEITHSNPHKLQHWYCSTVGSLVVTIDKVGEKVDFPSLATGSRPVQDKTADVVYETARQKLYRLETILFCDLLKQGNKTIREVIQCTNV